MLARIIRDYIDDTIESIIIDDDKFYEDFLNAQKHFIPHSKIKVENMINLLLYLASIK